jgi:hypothetical protein
VANNIDNHIDNVCYFMTKSGGFKSYEICIRADAIVFSRPHSSKQQALTYALDAVHCVRRRLPSPQSQKQATKGGKLDTFKDLYCINIVSSHTEQRSVFFKSEECVKRWYEEILTAQGFYSRLID